MSAFVTRTLVVFWIIPKSAGHIQDNLKTRHFSFIPHLESSLISNLLARANLAASSSEGNASKW